MQRFNFVELENYVVYDKARFDFTPGTHVVRGDNGLGKSLLFSTLGNLRYGTPPLSNKANQAKHFMPGGSRSTFDWSNHAHWRVQQKRSKSSVSYEISCDGKALDPHRIADARSRIETAFPLSAGQFIPFAT